MRTLSKRAILGILTWIRERVSSEYYDDPVNVDTVMNDLEDAIEEDLEEER